MSQAKSTGPLLQRHSLKPSTTRTSTCPIGHCCVCSRCYLPQKYFAIRQLTIAYNKQRMNILKVAGRVAWKPKIHDDAHLASLLLLLLHSPSLGLVANPITVPPGGGGGETHGNSWWGYAARFSKS